MKILVVGAGAVGGYFGGRLLEKGSDVTFLVREGRREQLRKYGLVIKSIHGDVTLTPKTLLTGEKASTFDVILLSTKAYHLDAAIESFRPFVGSETIIVPLLNGIAHFDKLEAEFGKECIVGGLCFIESTLDSEGRILQTSSIHDLVFGERSSEMTERIKSLSIEFSGTRANFRLSAKIEQDLHHKYMFITAMSGVTTLMRAPIGPILEESGGRVTLERLLTEIAAIMKSMKAPIADGIVELQMQRLAGLGYHMKSSMQRDMEKMLDIEGNHLQGYLLKNAESLNITAPILEAVYANLNVYEKMNRK